MTGTAVENMDDVRFRIVAARRMMYHRGLDGGVGGHVSVRATGEDAFWVSPRQGFDESMPEDICKLGFDMQVRVPSKLPPATGVSFHGFIYQARPDVNCVIHTHSKWISLLTTTGQTLDVYHVYAALFLDDVAFFKDQGALSAEQEGPQIVESLGKHRALLMSHHGAINVGTTLEQTTAETILLEQCAEQQVRALAIGGKPMPRITAESYRIAYTKGVGVQRYTWEECFRRLRKTDPEIFQSGKEGGP